MNNLERKKKRLRKLKDKLGIDEAILQEGALRGAPVTMAQVRNELDEAMMDIMVRIERRSSSGQT